MKIWIDADSCPAVIKEILYRSASRNKLQLTLVANQYMKIPQSDYIDFVKVGSGLNVADNVIVNRLQPGDLVITNDIPLASDVITKMGYALSPRGEIFTSENIGSRLSVRDFLESLRESGQDTGGPPPMGKNDRASFANQLDRFLTKHLKD